MNDWVKYLAKALVDLRDITVVPPMFLIPKDQAKDLKFLSPVESKFRGHQIDQVWIDEVAVGGEIPSRDGIWLTYPGERVMSTQEFHRLYESRPEPRNETAEEVHARINIKVRAHISEVARITEARIRQTMLYGSGTLAAAITGEKVKDPRPADDTPYVWAEKMPALLEIDGFKVHLINSPQKLYDEAVKMEHCIWRIYRERIARGDHIAYHVDDPDKVHGWTIGFDKRSHGYALSQIKGRKNEKCKKASVEALVDKIHPQPSIETDNVRFVRNYDEARYAAQDMGIPKCDFKYIARDDQMHGIRFAEHPDRFFFIKHSVHPYLIQRARMT